MSENSSVPAQRRKIDVLDKGFIEIVAKPENAELLIVNAARVSFGKWKTELNDSDRGLIRYLIKNKHDSPLRHVNITFRLKAPEFVMRQWYKHVVGIAYTPEREPDHAWNEISGRYVEYDPEFYFPSMFRKQSANNKQATVMEPINDEDSARKIYEESVASSYASYKSLLSLGVGKEIARAVLPLNFYTEVIWTASLQAILNFIHLRDHEGSQMEIREYAKALRELLSDVVPISIEAWDEFRSAH